jgi:hypothetical protein
MTAKISLNNASRGSIRSHQSTAVSELLVNSNTDPSFESDTQNSVWKTLQPSLVHLRPITFVLYILHI